MDDAVRSRNADRDRVDRVHLGERGRIGRWAVGLVIVVVGLGVTVGPLVSPGRPGSAVGTTGGSAMLTHPQSISGALIVFVGLVLLIEHALTRGRSRQPRPTTASATGVKRRTGVVDGRSSRSLAGELALLADLFARGALSADEFAAAKKRLLR